MFTGIVQGIGEVAGSERRDEGLRLAIGRVPFLDRLAPGDSVSLAGVCTTVVDVRDGAFAVDVVEATLARTTIGDWRLGDPVNLEPALRAGDPLGGHMVQGHVDGVGRVAAATREDSSGILDIALPEGLESVTAPQGSFAIDGVSLTVNRLTGAIARFAIIPYTWTHTTLGRLTPGARVNVEADLIGKYVARAVRSHARSVDDGGQVPLRMDPETDVG
ncbi:riboflavin synthase [Candidatus Palauibacter sp.]|uniref:riboflavin synthase n=1 Tax=Candidatus Palauibacter sp. TaxID=3101350 RepID=UPI003B025604